MRPSPQVSKEVLRAASGKGAPIRGALQEPEEELFKGLREEKLLLEDIFLAI